MPALNETVEAGLQINHKGYYRLTGNGPHKWKLMHRRVMEIALEQTNPITLSALGIQLDPRGKLRKLPEAWDVHHIDANKLHNCQCNLMLLDHTLHGVLFVNR